jgi:flagellar protein FlaG
MDATFSRANQRLASQGRSLAFDWDTDSRRVIVTVRDTQTNEVIRQVPTEQAMEIAKQISRSIEGFSELA